MQSDPADSWTIRSARLRASLDIRRMRRASRSVSTQPSDVFLNQMGRLLASFHHPHQVQSIAMESLSQYLGAERCYLASALGPKSGSMDGNAPSYSAIRAQLPAELPFEIFCPPAIDILSQGQPLRFTDTDPRFEPENPGVRALLALGIRSLVTIPWFDRLGKWQGTVTTIWSTPERGTEEDLRILHPVTGWAFLTLENLQLKQDLNDLRARLDLVTRQAPLVIFAVDRDLRYTWIDSPALGFVAEEMLGKRDDELFPGDSSQELVHWKRMVLETGQPIRKEVQVSAAEQTFTYDMALEPLYDADGQVSGLVGAALDVTELRRLENEQLLQQGKLEIQQYLIHARERQRMRLASLLHDGPLQDLLAIQFNLVTALEITDKATRLERLNHLYEMIQRSIDSLRVTCNELRPPVLAPFGLEKTIRSHAESLAETYPGLELQLDLAADGQRLPQNLRIMLFRTYQELIRNVILHAGARQVRVRFAFEGEQQAIIEVQDDGVGFEPPVDWVAIARHDHLGLITLQEWVAALGGRLEIDSHPGRGACVRVRVPLQSS